MKAIVLTVALLATISLARADISLPKKDNFYDKAGRGFANIVYAPAEFFDSTYSLLQTDGPTVAFSKGIVQGAGRTLSDIALGMFDVATAPLPIGPGFTYETYKSAPWDSMVVNEYPPADLKHWY